MTGPWRRAVVVGASSGVGEAIARELATRGARVALVARRAERLEQIRADIVSVHGADTALVYPHDVRATDEVPALFQRIAHDLGGLDLVVYAAGVMVDEGTTRYPTAENVEMIATNFSGAVAWLGEAAVRFGEARAGTIIGISSVAGDRGRKPYPVYGATKAALSSYLASLSARLRAKGVTVLNAKPGYVRTAMIEGVTLPRFFPVPGPEVVARRVLDAAADGKRVLYVPWWWRFVMIAIRAIPAPLFERLTI